MSCLLALEYRAGGVRLPRLGLWLDPHEPQAGPEKVFVSHAHSDHVAEHREVILTAPTARLMQARLSGALQEHVLSFGERRRFSGPAGEFFLTLFPAGHIFGSAMSLLEAGGETLLYTGDFKLRRGMSAEPCEPRRANLLVMETTFGRERYAFPPTESVLRSVVRFCREALDNDETPVLLGYSLGKSQELLCSLSDAHLPLMLHGTICRLTKVYEQFGQCFPPYEPYEAGAARGKVLLCPPHVVNAAMIRNLGRTRTTVLTGWAVDPGCRYQYQCDAAFPLSDHADFPDLIEMVKRVQPRKIYTLHGFAADFAQTLRDLGYDAQALSQDEQFALPLLASDSQSKTDEGGLANADKRTSSPRPPPPEEERERIALDGAGGRKSCAPSAAHSFSRFAETCARIRTEPGKLEKTRLLAEYFRTLTGEAVALAAMWLTGRPFPAAQNRVLQLGWAVLRDALCAATSASVQTFHQVYLKHSDLGETAAELLQSSPVEASLSLEDVNELFGRLHAARGPLAKTPLLTAALGKCSAIEGKFLVKILTGELRIGLKEGLVEEALASAFNCPVDEVRRANLLLGDVGQTARLAAESRLVDASLTPFRPVKFMLASPEETAADIWARIVEGARSLGERGDNAVAAGSGSPASIWVEDKYDGIRCQLHKVGRRVELYSRDLKGITATFAELVDSLSGMSADFILDGEIVAMRGEQVLPFAELQKRLGRREADLFMREEVPVRYVTFDLLWRDGATYLERPLRERRAALESLGPWPGCVALARITRVGSVRELEAAFAAARARGNEGLMIKDPESAYTPGRRGLSWLKLKEPLATLDCVVVGAEYGHGKRNNVLSDYTFAVRDEASGGLKIIGKAYTGLTDAEITELTQHFLSTAIRQHDRYFEVPPDTVLEIAFDKIQKSERHNSGLALRFPRIVRVRRDKPVGEIDTLATAWNLARAQVAEREL